MGANQSVATENPVHTTSRERFASLEAKAVPKRKTGEDSDAPTKFEKVDAEMRAAKSKNRKKRRSRRKSSGVPTPTKDQTISRDETKSVVETADPKTLKLLQTAVPKVSETNGSVLKTAEAKVSAEDLKPKSNSTVNLEKSAIPGNREDPPGGKSWYDWAFGK